jgi:hypothetical protein
MMKSSAGFLQYFQHKQQQQQIIKVETLKRDFFRLFFLKFEQQEKKNKQKVSKKVVRSCFPSGGDFFIIFRFVFCCFSTRTFFLP